MIRRSMTVRLPNAPRLILSAGVIDTQHGTLSATGVHRSRIGATARMRSEAAERIALTGSGLHKETPTAAARDWASAARAAIYEAIERVVVLSWWRGRPAARPSDAALEHCNAARSAFEHDTKGRFALLDLTWCGLPPTLVALSWNEEGRGIAIGAACRSNASKAAMDALKELCQMEFAAHLAMARLEVGRALAPSEEVLLARHRDLEVKSFDLSPQQAPDQSWDRRIGSLEALQAELARADWPTSVNLLPSPFADRYVAAAQLNRDVQTLRDVSDRAAWPCYV